jgi:hypothetical protein
LDWAIYCGHHNVARLIEVCFREHTVTSSMAQTFIVHSFTSC